jgi:radical SAM protein with 4Fe4S-binding SPASM domain
MIKTIQYKTFSWNTHKKNWRTRTPNVCQFELTFKCALNCSYCYASCYNSPDYIKKELSCKQVISILDKVHKEGIIWLCFTGGDPLKRPDFLDIYSYAKNRGFIITVFTNGYSMTKEIADYFAKKPPFVIEITLNSVTRDIYEKISNKKNSFDKTINGLDLLLKRNIPVKIKTQITKENIADIDNTKQFIENLGLKFSPSAFLHARLNGDTYPCSLRITPQQAANLYTGKDLSDSNCLLDSRPDYAKIEVTSQNSQPDQMTDIILFNCAIAGGDGINVDPYGNMIPCICIREPKMSLLDCSIKKARETLSSWIYSKVFTTDSACKACSLRGACYSCPGKALLESGDMEKPVEWFCEFAQITHQTNKGGQKHERRVSITQK